MKKLFGLLMILFVMYLSLQLLFVYIGNGHSIDYEIKDNDDSFEIHEEFNSNNDKDRDNYSLSININNTVFDILTYYDFKKSSKIVKNIKYYDGNDYKCIFVAYRDKTIIHDILCNNNDHTIHYNNILNPSEALTSFATNLIQYGYDRNQFIDNDTAINVSSTGYLYLDNMIKNHYIGIVNGNSLYRINDIDKLKWVNISGKNSIVLGAFTNDKYVILDNSDSEFKTYKIFSFTSSKNYSVTSVKAINNPILLGTYNDSIFIYDKGNGIEYEINTDTENVLEVGNNSTSIKYYVNGELEHKKIEEIDLNNLDFGKEYKDDYINPNFIKTIKIGNEYGYYYYFKNVNGYYEVYRSKIDNKDKLTYLFKTTDITRIQFINDYIYYVDNDILKYYNDLYGNRNVAKVNILNNNYTFKVYIDKTKEA